MFDCEITRKPVNFAYIEDPNSALMSTLTIDQFCNSHRIDLHTHTTCSDGKLCPKTLVDRATNFQLDVLAITDHDTISGLSIANEYILEKNIPLTLIKGIEISTRWHGFDIHVVGLNIDDQSPELLTLISAQQAAREERAANMGEKLAKAGFSGIYQEAKKLAGAGTITRSHFAQVLFNRGEISNLQAAFDKYIGKGKRAFVKPQWCEIKEAIDVIHQAGGSAVLAHPIRYDLSAKWRRRLVEEFKEAGGDALEIVLPQMSPDHRKQMLKYCQEYDLHASLGSDFHSPSKWSDLGKNLHLPDDAEPVWALWQ